MDRTINRLHQAEVGTLGLTERELVIMARFAERLADDEQVSAGVRRFWAGLACELRSCAGLRGSIVDGLDPEVSSEW